VLERGHEELGVLTDGEMTAIAREIDAIGTSDRVQERLRLLRVAIEMLDVDDLTNSDSTTAYENHSPSLLELWSSSALTVVTTNGSSRRRKELRDTLLFHAALTAIREHPATSNRALLVLGGDHLQDWALEDMTRQAERRGVRLVLFLQHMHDHVARLVGSSASSTVFMRLGNGKEATAAAEQIGRGHRFLLSQFTRQRGVTSTTGGGSSTAKTESTATTRQTGTTSTGLLASSASEGSSFTQSVGATASQMSNWSTALNTSESRVEQRVYEFAVEPVALQQLPPTAFFLVEGARGGERAVLGDCHVSIALERRVASQPIWG
jgi:hypothetical protein